MKRGLANELVSDELVSALVANHLGSLDTGGFILDGYPRTTAQADDLEGALKEIAAGLSAVILFEAPQDILFKRLTGRRACNSCHITYNIYYTQPQQEGLCDRCHAPLSLRSDDNEETVKHRLEVYHEQTSPLIDYYEKRGSLVRVYAPGSAEAMYSSLIDTIAELDL